MPPIRLVYGNQLLHNAREHNLMLEEIFSEMEPCVRLCSMTSPGRQESHLPLPWLMRQTAMTGLLTQWQ
jgi:hypothetical protein